MEWIDEGIALAVRPHGESDAVLSALTFEHGRHLGLVKGGSGRRARPFLQPGNRLGLTWKARLPEHLGHFSAEPMQLFGSRLLDARLPLAALASACALLEVAPAEREPHPRLYAGLLKLLEGMLTDPRWAETYVRFELLLLQELGFALDLAACAVTGAARFYRDWPLGGKSRRCAMTGRAAGFCKTARCWNWPGFSPLIWRVWGGFADCRRPRCDAMDIRCWR